MEDKTTYNSLIKTLENELENRNINDIDKIVRVSSLLEDARLVSNLLDFLHKHPNAGNEQVFHETIEIYFEAFSELLKQHEQCVTSN